MISQRIVLPFVALIIAISGFSAWAGGSSMLEAQ